LLGRRLDGAPQRAEASASPAPKRETEWWRDAVFYEIYVRSFADSDGDGVGDLPGIRDRLPYLRYLGVDAVWLTPFYPSPGVDHGYDVSNYVDVDPLFGTLADFDELLAAAHELGMRLIVDLVPNHTSNAHPWFAGDRSRYVTVPAGDGLPNNWPSAFGGPAWTLDEARGEYYLHLFAPEQPDLDWHNQQVRADFDEILRFWLDRGVDGFRIDVAHGLVKAASLADEPEPMPVARISSEWRSGIDQPEVHDVYRDWRRLVDSYDGDRVLVGEVVFTDQSRIAPYLRADELHLAFNFSLVFQPWDADAIRRSIDESLAALPIVTWVFENHDVTRIATRFGEREARASALLLLALPGPVFLYQGQELGLEEVDLPDELRQDPVFARTGGERKGRDGARVPLPWARELPARSWLPQPEEWRRRSVEAQLERVDSTLSLYRRAIELRPSGDFEWRDSPPGVLAFARDGVTCLVNFGPDAVPLPDGEVLLASDDVGGELLPNTGAWIR
jgi:alpha-glucosidase